MLYRADNTSASTLHTTLHCQPHKAMSIHLHSMSKSCTCATTQISSLVLEVYGSCTNMSQWDRMILQLCFTVSTGIMLQAVHWSCSYLLVRVVLPTSTCSLSSTAHKAAALGLAKATIPQIAATVPGYQLSWRLVFIQVLGISLPRF